MESSTQRQEKSVYVGSSLPKQERLVQSKTSFLKWKQFTIDTKMTSASLHCVSGGQVKCNANGLPSGYSPCIKQTMCKFGKKIHAKKEILLIPTWMNKDYIFPEVQVSQKKCQNVETKNNSNKAYSNTVSNSATYSKPPVFTNEERDTSISYHTSSYHHRKKKLQPGNEIVQQTFQNCTSSTVVSTAGGMRMQEHMLKEKLRSNFGLIGLKTLQAHDYVIPAKNALFNAISTASDIQNSLLRREWKVVKGAFNFNGGILSPKSLRVVLIHDAKLTLLHAQRIEKVVRGELMKPCDKFVLYEEFRAYFKYKKKVDGTSGSYLHENPSFTTGASSCEEQVDSDEEHMEAEKQNIRKKVVVLGLKPDQVDLFMKKSLELNRLRELREKLSGVAHARGELHRDDALLLLKGLGSSLRYLSELQAECTRNLKTLKVGYAPPSFLSIPPHAGCHEWNRSTSTIHKGNRSITATYSQQQLLDDVFLKKATEMQDYHRREEEDQRHFDESRRRKGGHHHGSSTSGFVVMKQSIVHNLTKMRRRAAMVIQRNAKKFLRLLKHLEALQVQFILSKNYQNKKRYLNFWLKSNEERACYLRVARLPFVRWKQHASTKCYKNHVFVTCFWPFYTWRKEWSWNKVARQKALILKRVWWTYLQLLYFRKWTCYVSRIHGYAHKAEEFHHILSCKRVRFAFTVWKKDNAFKLYVKRKFEEDGGSHILNLSVPLQLVRYLRMWWYYAFARRLSRRRARENYMTTIQQQRCMGIMFTKKGSPSKAGVISGVFRTSNTVGSIPLPFPAAMHAFTVCGLKNMKNKVLESINFDLLCKPILETFDRKDQLCRIKNYLLFQTIIPKLFNCWVNYVEFNRKKRYLWHMYATKCSTRIWLEWRKFVFFSQMVQFNQNKDNLGSNCHMQRTRSFSVTSSRSSRPVGSRAIVLLDKQTCGDIHAECKIKWSSNTSTTNSSSAYHGDIKSTAIIASTFNSLTSLASSDLKRTFSLEENTLKLACIQFEVRKMERERKRQGLDVKERLQHLAFKREEKARMIKQYAEQWKQEVKEAEEGAISAQEEIRTLRQQQQEGRDDYREYENFIHSVEKDQLESIKVAENILKKKSIVLQVQKQTALEQGKRLYRFRAEMLHDVLCKVITEIQREKLSHLVRKCFNRIRLLLLQKRSLESMNRGKLQHYVDICVNFRKLNNSMPTYRRLRILWGAFNRWLGFMATMYKYDTSGLKRKIRRKACLVKIASEGLAYLYHQGVNREMLSFPASRSSLVVPVVGHHPSRAPRSTSSPSHTTPGVSSIAPVRNVLLQPQHSTTTVSLSSTTRTSTSNPQQPGCASASPLMSTSSLQKVHGDYIPLQQINVRDLLLAQNIKVGFLRWLEYTQGRHVRKFILILFQKRRELRERKNVFVCLRDTLKARNTFHKHSGDVPCIPFNVLCVDHDLENIKYLYLTPEAKTWTQIQRRKTRFILRRLKMCARNKVTMKETLLQQRDNVEKRKEVEQRLLLAAFHCRGQYDFTDTKQAQSTTVILQQNDGRLSGKLAERLPIVTRQPRQQDDRPSATNRSPSPDKKDPRKRWGALFSSGETEVQAPTSPSGDTSSTHSSRFDDQESNQIPILDSQSGILEIVVYVSKAASCVLQGIQLKYYHIREGREMLTDVHGGGGGNHHQEKGRTRHSFHLHLVKGEKLIGVQGIYNHFIRRIRFHTSMGRVSPWYGEPTCYQGSPFMLGQKLAKKAVVVSPQSTTTAAATIMHQNKPTNSGGNRQQQQRYDTSTSAMEHYTPEFIIGFYGRCTSTCLLDLGVYKRTITEKAVFMNCWKNKLLSLNDSGKEKTEIEENREFAIVLSMREADIQSALNRSQIFAKKLYKNRCPTYQCFTKMHILMGLSSWLFNSLSKSLLPLPENGDVSGETMVREGQDLVEQGRNLISKAKSVFTLYGDHLNISETKYGRVRTKQILRDIKQGGRLDVSWHGVERDGQRFSHPGETNQSPDSRQRLYSVLF